MKFSRGGRLDRRFGDRGLVCFSSPDPPGFVSVATDGRSIFIGGPNGRALLRRLTARGRLERRFGQHGVVSSKPLATKFVTPEILIQDRHHLVLLETPHGGPGVAVRYFK
jgi:hypothetical protein